MTAILMQCAPAVLGINGLPRRLSGAVAGAGRTDHIALTFDDGPHPEGTHAVLSALAEARVTATFFLIADHVADHTDLVRRIVDGGHEIALHGWDHRPLPLHFPLRTWRILRAARDALQVTSGQSLRWYRPPYGVATGSALLAATALGLRPIWWTAWGRDWSPSASAASITARVLRTLGPGGTVLLHDSDRFAASGSWQHTVAALPAIIEACTALGCTVGPLSEHW